MPLISRRGTVALGLAAGAALGKRPARAEMPALLARPIPHSGEMLPVVGLGTANGFDEGDDAARNAARLAVVQTLVDGGAKIIDTAPSYGRTEGVLGDLLAGSGLRPRVFLATKLESYDRPAGAAALQASLRRLKTGAVDLVQLHNVNDPNQDLAMLRAWKASGLTRYIGITTTYRGAFDAAEAILKREKPDFVEIDNSLEDREAERRVIPAAAEVGAAVLIALPFGRGRLFRAVQHRPVPDWAKAFGAETWGQFFLKYLIGNPAVTAVIPGTTNPAHMADDLGAGQGRPPDVAERARMIALFASPG